jgi:very-short-patch-repair endonuclease
MSDGEAKLARIALRQHSVFSRRHAIAAGFFPQDDRPVRPDRPVAPPVSGCVHRLERPDRVEATAHGRLPRVRRNGCGVPPIGARRVWGFAMDLFVPEVTIPSGARRVHPGIEIHRSNLIERSRRDGFPVTKPMRTLLDAAGCVPEDRIDRMVDDGLRRGLIHLERFQRYVAQEESRSRPGSGTLRSVLALRKPGRPIGSDPETILFRILRDCGLPLPEPQLPVATRRGKKYIDFAYPDAMLAIEVDGLEEHGTRAAFETDRARQNEIELLGFHFLRFTWTQITTQQLDVGITVGLGLGLCPVKWRTR